MQGAGVLANQAISQGLSHPMYMGRGMGIAKKADGREGHTEYGCMAPKGSICPLPTRAWKLCLEGLGAWLSGRVPCPQFPSERMGVGLRDGALV